MTSPHLIDAEQLLADQLAEASPDLLRGLLSVFIHALMGAEADALCGAGYRQRSDERADAHAAAAEAETVSETTATVIFTAPVFDVIALILIIEPHA